MTMDDLQARLCRLFKLSEKRAILAEEEGNDEIQLRTPTPVRPLRLRSVEPTRLTTRKSD